MHFLCVFPRFVLWTAIDHAKFDISNSSGKRVLFGSSSDSSLALERGQDRIDFRYFAEVRDFAQDNVYVS